MSLVEAHEIWVLGKYCHIAEECKLELEKTENKNVAQPEWSELTELERKQVLK